MVTVYRKLRNEFFRAVMFLKDDKKMFRLLVMKDIYWVGSALIPGLRRTYQKYADAYVKRLDVPEPWNVYKAAHKALRDGVNFYHRVHDLETLWELSQEKDYALHKEYLPKLGHVIIDAGAGVGEYTITASLGAGKNGKVIAVEANSEPFVYLSKNAQKTPHKNIIALRAAISDRPGKLKLFRPRGTTFIDSITKNWEGPTVSYTVTAVPIDDLVRKHKLNKLDLLKIDIEGAEMLALRGAQNTLKILKPKLMIETHSRELHKNVLKTLKNAGYRIDIEKVKFTEPFVALVYAAPLT